MLTHFNYNLETNYRFLDNPKDKVVGVVLQTKNYSQFHMDGLLNRQLDTPHVRELNRYKTVSTINVIASSFEVGSPIQYGGGLNKKIRDGKYKFDESKKTKNEKFFDFMTLLHQKSGSNHRIPANVQQAIRLWYLNPKVDKNRLIQVIDEELIKRAPRNTSLCAQLIGKKYNTRLRKGKINYYISNKGTFGFSQEA